MSEMGERLVKALEGAVKNPKGVKRHEISEVRRIRNKLNMSVAEFSKTFNLPKRTVERWDMEDKGLTGAVATLMRVIDKNPDAVMKALRD